MARRGRPPKKRLHPGLRPRDGAEPAPVPAEWGVDAEPGDASALRAAVRAVRVRRFVRAFVAGGPGVAGSGPGAALAAGLSKTRAGAAFVGQTYLRDPQVLRYITRQLEAYDLGTRRALEELNRIVLTDARELDEARQILERGGTLRDLPDHVASVIGEISKSTTAEGGLTVRVKGYAKLEAIALFAKLRGLIQTSPQRLELTGPGGGPVRHEAVVVYLPANGRDPVRGQVIDMDVGGGSAAGQPAGALPAAAPDPPSLDAGGRPVRIGAGGPVTAAEPGATPGPSTT